MDHPSEVNATKVDTYRVSMAQIIPGVIGVIFGIGILLFFIGGGIENKVAKDAEAQYSIAARNGTAIDRCVHAGMVAAAYVQAKDETSYRIWKSRESSDCEIAGIRR